MVRDSRQDEPKIAAPKKARQGRVHLEASVTILPGVGRARTAMMEKAGLSTVYDLLTYLPLRYEDRRAFTPLAEAPQARPSLLLLSVVSARLIRTRRRDFTITECFLRDDSATAKVFWYNRPYLSRSLTAERRMVVYGEVSERSGGAFIENPEYELLEAEDDVGASPHFGCIVPVYRRMKSLSPRGVRKLMRDSLGVVIGPRDDQALDERDRAFWDLHFPQDLPDAERGRELLAYRELREFQLGLALARSRRGGHKPQRRIEVEPERELATLAEASPHPLTDAQTEALARILADLGGERPMGRLLHGEVGAGKTLVALLSAAPVLRAGRQVALLAPTAVLAWQLHREAERCLGPLLGEELSTELLAGQERGAERNARLLRIARGEARLVVGTHALFQERVSFHDLSYVIVDEQHRFGVFQRHALMKKAAPSTEPDLLVMSATPIPRTLTLTMFGDMDVSRMVEVPPGRKPVATRVLLYDERKQAYDALEQAVERKEQGFVVVPRIEDDPKLARSSLKRIVRGLQEKRPHWRIGVLHGQLKGHRKDEVLGQMRRGQLDVVVSTTVVEVGVDVPKATVMLVLGAEGYGLSQLHQLRGRIGRGGLPGSCFFVVSRGQTSEVLDRLRVLEECNDGFAVAEADWEQRGPGDLAGTRQWGVGSFRLVDLRRMAEWLDRAREEAAEKAAGMSDRKATRFLSSWSRKFGMARVG